MRGDESWPFPVVEPPESRSREDPENPMSKLIEVTHVALGGEQGDNAWAQPYLDDEHNNYSSALLSEADMLLLGRSTYEGLSAAYTAMAEHAHQPPTDFDLFIARMNALPKLVASTTLRGKMDLPWNATVIDGDVAGQVADLKQQPGHNMVKYGDGPLSATLARRNLIDEYHLFLTPVAVGTGKHLFADIDWAPHLNLLDVVRFASGVVVLVYGAQGDRPAQQPLAPRSASHSATQGNDQRRFPAEPSALRPLDG